MYPETIQKISVVTYSIINNHGFIDGNKRIGVVMMLMLLNLNELKISYSQSELVSLGLGVASGEIKEDGIEKWIKQHLG